MEIKKFVRSSEFLYHLTDRRNWEIIKNVGVLLSSKAIIDKSALLENEKNILLNNIRPINKEIIIESKSYFLRDQKSISEKNLIKYLPNGWSISNYIRLLNERVFFWPNLARLGVTMEGIVLKIQLY